MLAKGLGPVERGGGVSGVFPSWRWSRLIRLHPCPVLITPPEGVENKKKKQRPGSGDHAATRSVIPRACPLLQSRQRMLLAPALINLYHYRHLTREVFPRSFARHTPSGWRGSREYICTQASKYLCACAPKNLPRLC